MIWCLTSRDCLDVLIRLEVASSRPDHLPTLSAAKASKHSLLFKLRWYGHIVRREDGHVLRMVVVFEVEGLRGHGKSRLRQNV